MKLQELLQRFCFDGYFVDYHESKYLTITPVYSHQDLAKKAKKIEGEYHIEMVDIGFGQLRVAICSNERTLDGQSAIAYIETEKSYQKRSQNCCDICEYNFSGLVFSSNSYLCHHLDTKALSSWNPLSNESLDISHKIDPSGQICAGCKKEDPSLAKYIANMRVSNSIV